ncbi:MAG: DCC1-like thiol-disulfide oxidoreductase family protein [Lacunisphaera sp.]
MARPVLLYDGECGLCNRLVLSLLHSDSGGRLNFAPLQSPPAQGYLRSQGLPLTDFNSLVFVLNWDEPVPGGYRLRTDGALAACAVVGGGWRALSWLRILPRWLRDFFYRIIARTRYALFGQYRPVPLPNSEWEKRFLAR